MVQNGFKVMDSDMHVQEPFWVWEQYLDPAFRDRAPQVSHEDGRGPFYFEGRAFPAYSDMPARARLHNLRVARSRGIGARYQEARSREYDPVAQIQAMDIEGIDVAISFRGLGGHFLAIDDLEPALAAALARAFNRWMYDRGRTSPSRLQFAALVPLQDVELAIAEARFAVKELGAIALSLPSNPVKQRTLYHPDYDRLWAELEDLNVTIGFHGLQAAYQDHLAFRYIDNLVLSRSVAQPVELMLALGAMLAGGVFERFPGLRAGFLEGTCGWLPWWLWKLDEEWEKFGAGELHQLKMLPSEYFRRHCAIAVDPEEALVKQVIAATGDDNIVISTDWPHDDALYPRAISTFLSMAGVSEESKRKILWDNCAWLYRLPA